MMAWCVIVFSLTQSRMHHENEKHCIVVGHVKATLVKILAKTRKVGVIVNDLIEKGKIS